MPRTARCCADCNAHIHARAQVTLANALSISSHACAASRNCNATHDTRCERRKTRSKKPATLERGLSFFWYHACGVAKKCLSGKRFHALCKTGHFARSGVLVDHTLLRGAHDLGLCRAKRCFRRALVAACERFLDLADEGAHAAAAGPVDCRLLCNHADCLLCGLRVRHRSDLRINAASGNPGRPAENLYLKKGGSRSSRPPSL